MSLRDIIANGVAIADRITKPLQATVQHEVWQSQTFTGTATYASAVARKALVDQKQLRMKDMQGQEVLSRIQITFLTPVLVSVRDRLTLANGATGPILSVGGFVDSKTDQGYFTEVYLG